MRLIDADDFLLRMKEDTDLCAEMEIDGMDALKKYLDLQPTAFDVEKVANELEAQIGEYQKYNYPRYDHEQGFEQGCEFAFEKAIQIVRGGENESRV